MGKATSTSSCIGVMQPIVEVGVGQRITGRGPFEQGIPPAVEDIRDVTVGRD